MSLSRSIATGVKWSSVSQGGRQLFQWTTNIILARLLVPEDFGLAGMAMVVVGFSALFVDLGTQSAIIREKEMSEDLLDSVFWFNAALGLLVAVAMFVAAEPVAQFFDRDELVSIVKVLAVVSLMSSLQAVHRALLTRKMDFKSLARVEVCSVVAGAAMAISMAFGGYGVWSLVWQFIVQTAFSFIGFWWVSTWRPRMIFSLKEIRRVWSYSMNLTGFLIFNYVIRNADNLLIGKFIGAVELGYYGIAYRFLLYPVQNISNVVSRVLMPALSKVQDDNERFGDVYLKTVRYVAFITFPVMVGLFAVADPMVRSLLGEKWRPVVLLIMILAPVGLTQSIGATVGTIYQAKGRTDWQFRWGVGAGTFLVLAYVVGLKWGIIGVAVSYLVASCLLLYPNFAIPFSIIKLPLNRLVLAVFPALVCSLIMLAVVAGARRFLFFEMPFGVQLAALVVTGVVVYPLASYLFNRRVVIGIVSEIQRQFGSAAQGGSR